MPKITFRNVKKVYPSGSYALDGVNFEIEQGDFICIIGESGGGKTTLLKLISGLDKATSGEIFFDDEISNYMKVAQRNVAFVFQEYTIYPNMTVFENIVLSLKSHKISYEEKRELAWDIIQKMGLEVISGEVPKVLSFGQCQKVALAKALVRKPKIILFDEPLSNIDAYAKTEYKKLIMEAKNILPDCTFVYVTHNIGDAMQLSNKIMIIDNGKIIQFDKKQVVYQYPNTKLVADYMLEGKKEEKGVIVDGVFKSQNNSYSLSNFQKFLIGNKQIDNVICYSIGNINVFFDESGDVIGGLNTSYKTDMIVSNRSFTLLGNSFNLDLIEKGLLKIENLKAVLKQEHFSLNKNGESLEFEGQISYQNADFLIIKIKDLLIPILNNSNYEVGDKVIVYYPVDELKAIDENNNQVIASYEISNNELDVKIVNSKKGIFKLNGKKFQSNKLIGKTGVIKIKIPLNAFVFDKKGVFICNSLYNEEFLGDVTLLYFSAKGVSDYLSATVKESFKGYNKNKIKFNIDFNKIEV